MSENIPTQSPRRKSKHKYDKLRLPTPPPDPTLPGELQKEADNKNDTNWSNTQEFLTYLDALQKSTPALSRSASVFSPAIVTQDAFDHLERLYKLMDQMLALREQNARLHRRVRDLEHFSNLEKLRKQLQEEAVEEDFAEWDKDAAFAESIFENIFSASRRDGAKFKQPAPSRFRQSILRRQRNRSSSIGTESSTPQDHERSYKSSRRTSEVQGDDAVKPAKVSKWTKVKAAFKWEKTSPTVGDSKMSDSGIGGMLPINVEVARYLRVPSTSDEPGLSPADSGAAEISTPGSISNTSSTDDISRKEIKDASDDYRSSEDEHHQYLSNEYIPLHKGEKLSDIKSSHRTPWAKMKDIIQTRNSFKKRHRLSARSDDTRPDEILYSENEDVFEDDCNCRVLLTAPQEADLKSDETIAPEIVERYRQAVDEEKDMAEMENLGMRKVSRWTRVKKAFLASQNETTTKTPLGKVDSVKKAKEEIERNYKQLQEKLSQEFHDKLQEWEKTKSIPSTSGASPVAGMEEHLKKMEEWQKIKAQPPLRQLHLQSEENLPPEFKKKLQEWQKMKESQSPKRKPAFEYPQLSEDFLKKLEEWKQIKASGGPTCTEEADCSKYKENKTPSPNLVRKASPLKYKKSKDPQEKELQWFEKELGKIEKEKQRLERERQKFLEREERLTKLRRSVMGGSNKKEVLVHTRTGFHRFEGISRKFTQKLYEWEKAQGIAPEESTFALLTSSYAPEIRPPKTATPPLVRSKSADSIASPSLNLNCPIISQQPSSLSLNDVEELEKECLAASKSSSAQYMSQYDDNMEDLSENEEPEALIVEVEDIIEETAAPLENFLHKRQTPVYQHEGIKSFCAGEACIAPKIRRSESTRAQTNYNLIENGLSLLKQMLDNQLDIRKMEENFSRLENEQDQPELKDCYHNQQKMAINLHNNFTRLQEVNSAVIANIFKEDTDVPLHHLTEVTETIQDLSNELSVLAEKLKNGLFQNNNELDVERKETHLENLTEMNGKLLELRRLLSYMCAASDVTAPGKKKGFSNKQTVVETKECGATEETVKYMKSDNVTSSQGAIKKRLRHKQKSMQSKVEDESDEDERNEEKKSSKHKKLSRAKSVPEDVVVDPALVEKVVVPTESNYVTVSDIEKPPDSPVTIFVKTTRKLFTPIVERSIENKSAEQKEERLPPLPASPTPQRKFSKEISPNIRIMLQRYNQKLSEQDSSGVKSGGSSGSNSPVAWRSPVSERRVKAQTEKYQEKLSPLLGSRKVEVQKSASAGILKQITTHHIKTNFEIPETRLSKSSSTGVISGNEAIKPEGKKANSLKLTIHKALATQTSPENRYKRIQKAKEEFLNFGSSSAPVSIETRPKFPIRNRFSQISVESESSCDSSACCEGLLIKSASAGMINIDADAYRKIDPEVHREGYVSLPRNCKKHKQGFLGNIASKFRKMRMRRKERDPSKMAAVSALCRQSLVVDIHKSEGDSSKPNSSKSSTVNLES